MTEEKITVFFCLINGQEIQNEVQAHSYTMTKKMYNEITKQYSETKDYNSFLNKLKRLAETNEIELD